MHWLNLFAKFSVTERTAVDVEPAYRTDRIHACVLLNVFLHLDSRLHASLREAAVLRLGRLMVSQ